METLKSIFKFYIDGSIHVALAVCALVEITYVRWGMETDYSFLAFVFFGSVAAYNFVKYSKEANLYHATLTASMESIRVLTIVSLIGFVYFGWQLETKTMMYIVPFVLLTILYAIPIFPNKKNLRSVAGIKIFIIAIVWSGITVFIALVHGGGELNFDFIIECIQRFIFIVVMMLPFEIRDLQFDDKSLETVPQKIGITRTKVFGSILLVILLLLTATKDGLSSSEILSTISITTISLLFLWGTEKRQSEYYCSFWVESIPIFWLGIYMGFQYLFG